jgi:hypothetical protein
MADETVVKYKAAIAKVGFPNFSNSIYTEESLIESAKRNKDLVYEDGVLYYMSEAPIDKIKLPDIQ